MSDRLTRWALYGALVGLLLNAIAIYGDLRQGEPVQFSVMLVIVPTLVAALGAIVLGRTKK